MKFWIHGLPESWIWIVGQKLQTLQTIVNHCDLHLQWYTMYFICDDSQWIATEIVENIVNCCKSSHDVMNCYVVSRIKTLGLGNWTKITSYFLGQANKMNQIWTWVECLFRTSTWLDFSTWKLFFNLSAFLSWLYLTFLT
jgi:hypothetical protein